MYNPDVRQMVFNALTLVSLLLFVAVAVMWVRSYWIADVWLRGEEGKDVVLSRYDVEAKQGGIYYERLHIWPNLDGKPRQAYESNVLGFHWGRRYTSFDIDGTVITSPYPTDWYSIPFWWAAVSFAILPAAWVFRKLVRRNPRGFCSTCGYDLRATPERCPECGTVPAL